MANLALTLAQLLLVMTSSTPATSTATPAATTTTPGSTGNGSQNSTGLPIGSVTSSTTEADTEGTVKLVSNMPTIVTFSATACMLFILLGVIISTGRSKSKAKSKKQKPEPGSDRRRSLWRVAQSASRMLTCQMPDGFTTFTGQTPSVELGLNSVWLISSTGIMTSDLSFENSAFTPLAHRPLEQAQTAISHCQVGECGRSLKAPPSDVISPTGAGPGKSVTCELEASLMRRSVRSGGGVTIWVPPGEAFNEPSIPTANLFSSPPRTFMPVPARSSMAAACIDSETKPNRESESEPSSMAPGRKLAQNRSQHGQPTLSTASPGQGDNDCSVKLNIGQAAPQIYAQIGPQGSRMLTGASSEVDGTPLHGCADDSAAMQSRSVKLNTGPAAQQIYARVTSHRSMKSTGARSEAGNKNGPHHLQFSEAEQYDRLSMRSASVSAFDSEADDAGWGLRAAVSPTHSLYSIGDNADLGMSENLLYSMSSLPSITTGTYEEVQAVDTASVAEDDGSAFTAN